MADCKACGEWFGTTTPQDLCPPCERALKRLGGYVAPVRHGRWMIADTVIENAVCSCCRKHFQSYYEAYFYCPNCGALMDGGKDDG